MKRHDTILRGEPRALCGAALASIEGGGLPLATNPKPYQDRGTSVRHVDTPRGQQPIMYADTGGGRQSGSRESGIYPTRGDSRGTQADQPARTQNPWDSPGPAWR